MVPNVPVACILSIGFIIACRIGLGLMSVFSFAADAFCWGIEGGGFPMKVSLSQDGSSSDRASRSQEDCKNFVNSEKMNS